jgi:hypothetical protein
MIAKLLDAGSYVFESLLAAAARRLERRRLRIGHRPAGVTVTGTERVPRADRMWS